MCPVRYNKNIVVIAGASPLISLGRHQRLGLFFSVLGRQVLVPEAVRDLVWQPSEGVQGVEGMWNAFFKKCVVVKVRAPRRFSSNLSRAGNAGLTLAIRKRAGLLLTDERFAREMATAEGIPHVGTLGLLMRAMKQEELSASETRWLVERLVANDFYVDRELFQAVLAEIDAHERS